jgi:hypothetical protein
MRDKYRRLLGRVHLNPDTLEGEASPQLSLAGQSSMLASRASWSDRTLPHRLANEAAQLPPAELSGRGGRLLPAHRAVLECLLSCLLPRLVTSSAQHWP